MREQIVLEALLGEVDENASHNAFPVFAPGVDT
jgi:hypothetical protein